MPLPTPPPIDNGLIDHFAELAKIVAPILGAIISAGTGLFLWQSKQQRETQREIINTIEEHAKEDDKIHDQLFTQLRDTDAKLNKLIGEHKAVREDANNHRGNHK